MIEDMGQLLDALDDIPYPPFEMAVLDVLGRVGIVYADEDAVLGIQRLAFEDEANDPDTVTEADFPMIRLVPDHTNACGDPTCTCGPSGVPTVHTDGSKA